MSESAENTPSALKSFVACKCPRCRKGRVFHEPLYKLGSLLKAYDNCPVCEVKYEQETGFYWSAMYISYGLSTGLVLFIGIFMVSYDIPLFKNMKYLLTLIFLFILQIPISFRYSRMLAIYLIAPYRKYNPNYKTEKFEKK